MKLLSVTVLFVAFVLIGCNVESPVLCKGDKVMYRVNDFTGTGVVVSVQERLENGNNEIYYKIDAGVDGLGKRDQALLHSSLVAPLCKK
jgi:hypothetical protein